MTIEELKLRDTVLSDYLELSHNPLAAKTQQLFEKVKQEHLLATKIAATEQQEGDNAVNST